MVVLGSAPNIQPQKAKTFSYGVDFKPPFVPGLNLSVNYWNIDFQGIIAVPNFTSQVDFWTNFGSLITVNPTQAQVDAFKAQSNSIVGGACAPQPTCIYAIIDGRKKNLANLKVDGLDVAASYKFDTGFGSIDFGVNGTYDLSRKQQAVAGAPFVDLLAANNSRLKVSTSAGTQISGLRAQVIWNHNEGYKLNPAVGIALQQTRVSSFDVINLFFKYDLPGEGLLKNSAVTLNIDNVFDRDPPTYLQQSIVSSADGYINGNTVGRLVQVGVSKKF